MIDYELVDNNYRLEMQTPINRWEFQTVEGLSYCLSNKYH